MDITNDPILKNAEQVLKESEKRYAFLAQTVNELVGITSIKDLYAYTARKLHVLLENKSIVAIVEYNHEANRWKMQHIEGVGKKISGLSRVFGFDMRNLEGEISTKYYNQIISGKLVELEFDFPGLFNNRVSDAVEKTVKKLLSIEKLYCIAFKQDKQTFGNITIAVDQKSLEFNAELIEAFVNQVSIFIKKHKTEEALNKTERQYSALLESISDSVSVLDKDYRIILTNEASTRFADMTREHLLGNKLTDLFPGVEKTEFFKVFKKVMKTRESDIVSNEYTFEDGRKAWYEANVDPVPEGILCILRDISSRKRVELALQESNSRLESFLQISQKMALTSGQGQIIQMIVDNATSILGLGSGAVYLLQDQESIKLAATAPALPEGFPETLRITSLSDHPHVEQVFKTGNHVIMPDTQKVNLTAPEQEIIRLRNLRSNLYLPIRLREKTIGTLILSSIGKPHHFTDEEIRLLLGFANQTAHIIDNNRNFEDLTKHAAKLEEHIAERKQAERALLESEEKHRRLVEQMQEGLVVADLRGVIQFVNPMLCELTGYAANELIGKSGYDILLKPADIEIMRNRDTKRSKNISEQYEMDIFMKSGELRTFWFHAVPDKDRNGNIIGSMSTVIDITERKNAQEKIRITKDTYESIFNSVSEAIYVIDESGNFIDINRGAELMYGYPKEEMTRKSPAAVSATGLNDLGALEKVHQEVSLTGVSQSIEFWGVRKTGEIFPKEVIVNKATYFGKECLLATARDISRRKKAETSQKIQFNIARSIHNASSVENLLEIVRQELGLLFDTTNFFVAKYNPETDTLKQLIFRDEIDGFDEWDATHSISGHVVKSGETVFLRGDEMCDFCKSHNIDALGTNSACWLGVPIFIRNKVAGVMVVQHYTNPDAYHESNIALFEMVAHETGIYLERQMMLDELIIAKEKAEESNNLKTAFLQNLSHEIRTPLNGIIGFSEFINDPELTPEDRRTFTDIIIDRGWQLTAIINDVLTISALETKQEELFIDKININKLMRDQLAVFSGQAISKGIQLKFNLPFREDDAMIYTDKTKIGQILNNLFTNALKFTREGEIELGCQLKDNMLEFYVRDTGLGIDKSKQQIIFERFAQADDSIRQNFGGTGLGLSICKGFVELIGGEIWVDSEPGNGSIFYFTIPYNPAIQTDDIDKLFRQQVTNSTVLVAEDEETNFLYLSILLKKLNYKVLRAVNGQHAVDICRKEPVDIVLMDIKMPKMDGYAAARLIREFKPQLPIIAQTAHAAQTEIEKFQDVFDDYITKPFTKEKIRNLFEKNFDRMKTRSSFTEI
ncbi:MAG: PAS domain S-box protein [Bacteroidales bacterium]|nr:PAS domain S-box protein [Bacteroidales bacterium]